ncbi:MAG TPA: glycosyltransferase, partial [Cyclobacteriaceae bacterium]
QNYSTIHAQVNRYRTSSSVLKILYKTAFAFFKAYILKGGVLDGYKGLVVSGSTAHWVFYKYAKLLEANRTVRVSLIVESSGEVDDLERTLTSIRNQKELPSEVIVNGKLARAATKVPGIVANFPTPIKFVDSVTPAAINEAVNIAKEEYVLVLKDPAKLSASFMSDHKARAWKGKVVSGVDASNVATLTPNSEWKNILGNGTVAFWKEDWQTGNQKALPIPTQLPIEHPDNLQETRGISVVIPNYNGVSLFPQTLPPLFAALKRSLLPYEVIIVDDCSPDDSVGMLHRDYPEVRVIVNKVNQGFSPTINHGIREAVYDLVFLLNSDVKLELDYFVHLIPYFESNDTFGVMGQIVNWDDDRIQDGAKLPTFHGAKIKTFKNFLPSETPVPPGLFTMYLSGTETLVSKEKLQMLGGFDEIFAPYYIEDYELSLRAWRLGWKCYYDHRAICRHKTSSSIKSKSRKQHIQTIYYRNKMFLHAIHLNSFQMMFYYPQIFFECLIRVVSFRFHYVNSIRLFFRGRRKCKESKKRFEELSKKVGTNLTLAQVAKRIGDSLNRTIIWRF